MARLKFVGHSPLYFNLQTEVILSKMWVNCQAFIPAAFWRNRLISEEHTVLPITCRTLRQHQADSPAAYLLPVEAKSKAVVIKRAALNNVTLYPSDGRWEVLMNVWNYYLNSSF